MGLLTGFNTTTWLFLLGFSINTHYRFHLLFVSAPLPEMRRETNTQTAKLKNNQVAKTTLLINSNSQLLLLIDSDLQHIDLDAKLHSVLDALQDRLALNPSYILKYY